MKPNKYPLSRKENIVVQELDGEVLIYDLSENKAFCLNETSALVWEMCDGNKSISEISEGLGKKLNSKASEDLVWLAIDQLKKEKLIANSEEIAYDFNGMSRRDVIKKVGLGTMIALPIVTGLIAPTAINAQSRRATCTVTGTPGGQTADVGNCCPCNNTGDCAGFQGGAVSCANGICQPNNGTVCVGPPPPPTPNGVACTTPGTPGGQTANVGTCCPCQNTGDCTGFAGGGVSCQNSVCQPNNGTVCATT